MDYDKIQCTCFYINVLGIFMYFDSNPYKYIEFSTVLKLMYKYMSKYMYMYLDPTLVSQIRVQAQRHDIKTIEWTFQDFCLTRVKANEGLALRRF